jgi:hypothetical protein
MRKLSTGKLRQEISKEEKDMLPCERPEQTLIADEKT